MSPFESKNVLILLAHPEPQSLNHSLVRLATESLINLGHHVQVSDLYGMKWKAVADAEDFTQRENPDKLNYAVEAGHAFEHGTQLPDVTAEQEKLIWADAVIFQFPIWWFSWPAILKGWIDRVLVYKFAYGVDKQFGRSFGDGRMAGRRAMISVTIGARHPQYGPRGIYGWMDHLLFPLQHNVLWYMGMDVLPPFTVYQAGRVTDEEYQTIATNYRKRLERLFDDEPISFRSLHGGHYDDQLTLKPEFAPGIDGFSSHVIQPGEAKDHRLRRHKVD